MKKMSKKVEMKLVGIDGNAFFILGKFSKEARRQGWSKEEIDKVLDEARSGDYNHLLATIMEHVEEPFDEEDDEESPWDDEE
jgi:hypothetical protein